MDFLKTVKICDKCGYWFDKSCEDTSICIGCEAVDNMSKSNFIVCGVDFTFLASSKEECDKILEGTGLSLDKMFGPARHNHMARYETWELCKILST